MIIQIDIEQIGTSNFIINSKIPQTKTIHLQRENNQSTLQCNEHDTPLREQKKKGYWYHGTESVSIVLHRGKNHCHGQNLTATMAQKLNFSELLTLFILMGIPLYYRVFQLFILLLNRFKSEKNIEKVVEKEESFFAHKVILFVLFLGIIIRIFYFNKYNIMLFQHDWHGHIEFIKTMSQHWSLPVPTKGLEYPQQPLYYWITGAIYSLSTYFGFNEQSALQHIGYFSLFSSMLFLIYGYRLIALLSNNLQVKVVAMVFLALTPSLVYMSARINNDAMVMGLSAMALYSIVKSYKSAFKNGFPMALLLTTLLFLTKISTLGIELLLFSLLVLSYIHRGDAKSKKQIFIFGLVGTFLLTYTLWRVYMPIDGVFYMVNSSGDYPNQSIKELDFNYFGTFHFLSLFNAGYSYVFGEDSIRYSFLTYQYGTMFFGEFDYAFFTNKTPWLKEAMQMVLLFGMLFILGFITYLLKLSKASMLEKLLFATLFINFILILKFMFDYPSICNTDFRYFVSSFPIIAYVFAEGLSYVRWLKKIVNIFLALLVVSEILFFIGLIY